MSGTGAPPGNSPGPGPTASTSTAKAAVSAAPSSNSRRGEKRRKSERLAAAELIRASASKHVHGYGREPKTGARGTRPGSGACYRPSGRCSGSAGTRSSGRTRSSARRGARTSPRRTRCAPRPSSPRKLTYARPVEASRRGRDHGARPLRVSLAASGVVPARDGVEHERHRALRERRGALADPGDGAAHLVDVDLALRPGRGEVPLAERVDQLVVEPGEVRRLEVRRGSPSARAGRSASGSPRTASGRAGRRSARRPSRNSLTSAVAFLDRAGRDGDRTPPPSCRATPPGSPAAAARSSG